MLLTRVFHTPINAVPVASNFRYLFFLPKMPSCFPNIHFLHPFLLFCLSYFLFILTKKLLLRSMESKFQNFIRPPSSPIWSRQRRPPSPIKNPFSAARVLAQLSQSPTSGSISLLALILVEILVFYVWLLCLIWYFSMVRFLFSFFFLKWWW